MVVDIRVEFNQVLRIILQVLLYQYLLREHLIIKVLVQVPLYPLRFYGFAGVRLEDLSVVVGIVVSYPVPLIMLDLILVKV